MVTFERELLSWGAGIMPFHIGSHKPRTSAKIGRIWPRLVIAGFGAFLILWGICEFRYGRFLWLNRIDQPVYAAELIVGGAVLLACLMIPSSWWQSAGGRDKRRRTGKM